MNNFFDQLQAGSSIPTEKREVLLLNKLEQQQQFNQYLATAGQTINNATAAEKPFESKSNIVIPG